MKRVFAFALAAALCVGSFAGCSSSPAAPSSAPAAPSSTPVESKAPEAAPVTITVSTTYAGENANTPVYQEALKAWEDKTGNTVLDSSAVSDETVKARILASFETGSEPDVLFWFNGVDANPIVKANKVMPIDEIRQTYPDYATNMKDGMMGASPADGKNYSVPVNGYWEGMFVNKKVLETAGVKMPDATTTWDEFLGICQQIKDSGATPIAASLAGVPHYWFEYSIYNYNDTATHGVLPTSADDDRGKAFTSGITDIKDLYEKGYFPANTLSATDDETFELFIQDKAAFLIDGSWKVGGIENRFKAAEADLLPDPAKIANYTVTYVPGKNNRKTTDIIGGLSNGYYISRKAFEDTAKQAAVVDFVSFMTSDEMVGKFALVSATALKNGVSPDPALLSTLAMDGLALVKGATGMAPAIQDQIPTPCRIPVFDGMPDLVSGKKDIKAAVQECMDLIAAQ